MARLRHSRRCPANSAFFSTMMSLSDTSSDGSSMRFARSSSPSNTTARASVSNNAGVTALRLRIATAWGERAEQRNQSAHRNTGSPRERDVAAIDKHRFAQALLQCRAGHVARRQVQQVAQLPQQRGHAARGVEILHVTLAGRLQIHQHRRRIRQLIQPLQIDAHPTPPGDRRQMDQRIGRTAQRQQHAQRILHRCRGDDLRRPYRRCRDQLHRQRTGFLGRAQPRSACTAGIEPLPQRSTIPSASARRARVIEAVPITPQVPAVVARRPSISPIRSAVTRPARR